MTSELNSLFKFGTLNNSTSVSSSDDKEKAKNKAELNQTEALNNTSIHSNDAKASLNNKTQALFANNTGVDNSDLSNKMSSVDTSAIEQTENKGLFASILDGAKKMFGAQEANGPSKQSENLSTAQIQGAITFVSSHANGIDFDSQEFKQLDPKIQNYITAHYNQAVGKTSNTEN